MPDKVKRALVGAAITVALAVAVSYGLISQQTADKIQGEANQTLAQGQTPPGSDPQRAPAPAPQTTNPQTVPADPAPQPTMSAPAR